MKQLIVAIIACLVVVGCGSKSNYSGIYVLSSEDKTLSEKLKTAFKFDLKSNGTFSAVLEDEKLTGAWKLDSDFLIFNCLGSDENFKNIIKFNRKTLKLVSWELGYAGKMEDITKSLFKGEVVYLKNHIDTNSDLLTQCQTCKDNVSRNAEVCPHCGEPNPVKN